MAGVASNHLGRRRLDNPPPWVIEKGPAADAVDFNEEVTWFSIKHKKVHLLRISLIPRQLIQANGEISYIVVLV